jgi:hypothetical protein
MEPALPRRVLQSMARLSDATSLARSEDPSQVTGLTFVAIPIVRASRIRGVEAIAGAPGWLLSSTTFPLCRPRCLGGLPASDALRGTSRGPSGDGTLSSLVRLVSGRDECPDRGMTPARPGGQAGNGRRGQYARGPSQA